MHLPSVRWWIYTSQVLFMLGARKKKKKKGSGHGWTGERPECFRCAEPIALATLRCIQAMAMLTAIYGIPQPHNRKGAICVYRGSGRLIG